MSGPVEAEDAYEGLVAELAAELPAWLPTQRWFAGKDRDVASSRPLSWTVLAEGDPLLLHVVVEVEQGDRREPYQLLVGSRQTSSPDLPKSATIGVEGGLICYEAAGDAELTAVLLELLATGASVGDLRFESEPGAELETGLRAKPITSEQSNTSLVFGGRYILKLFRKLSTGVNKDLLLHRALRDVGCTYIADPLGAITGVLDGDPVTIGMLQTFVPGASDGWVAATAAVRDVVESTGPAGNFTRESADLGRAVATVHADLARALDTRESDEDDVERTVGAMLDRLGRVRGQVPELEPHVSAIEKAFLRLREGDGTLTMQHVHGDLHLGQVLLTPHGWLLLDFEGEPAATLAERLALRSPLRDVAGMLRSYDYAAQQVLVGRDDVDPALTDRVLEWARRNRAAFCEGYASVAGSDPRDEAELLLALELDKAVYEVSYEHANRPDWLEVPLASIARITSEGS